MYYERGNKAKVYTHRYHFLFCTWLQVTLVVNVASECGYTHLNYKELVKLQAAYSPDVFTVLAFPCNQFGQQEPGDEEEIVQFAKDQYGVTFPLFSKVDVQGDSACAVYRYLIGASGVTPSWNFCKYLVDQRGHVVQFFSEKDRFTSISQSVEYLLHRHKEL